MKRTIGIQWHITDECSQKCKHCYIYTKEGKKNFSSMNLEQINIVFNKIEKFTAKYDIDIEYAISGGDPLLNYNFWNLAQKLKDRKQKFTIMGNPYLLDEHICQKLKEYGCEYYQLSLDGLKQTHDWFRKEGSYEETIKKIKLINNAGIKSIIMTTVSEKNLNEIPDLIDIVVENEATIFAFARYCSPNKESSLKITPEDYKNLLDKCYKKFQKYKDSKTTFNYKDNLWKLYLYEKGLFKIPENINKKTIYSGCTCGINAIYICANGDLYACRRFTSKVGNIYNDELEEIFKSKKMQEYRKYDNFEKCSKCELINFCRGCPAVNYEISNNFYAPDLQCWKEI